MSYASNPYHSSPGHKDTHLRLPNKIWNTRTGEIIKDRGSDAECTAWVDSAYTPFRYEFHDDNILAIFLQAVKSHKQYKLFIHGREFEWRYGPLNDLIEHIRYCRDVTKSFYGEEV